MSQDHYWPWSLFRVLHLQPKGTSCWAVIDWLRSSPNFIALVLLQLTETRSMSIFQMSKCPTFLCILFPQYHSCGLTCSLPFRFLVQFKQDKVCVKFIQGTPKNGNGVACKRKNNRLLEVSVPSPQGAISSAHWRVSSLRFFTLPHSSNDQYKYVDPVISDSK